MIEKFSVYILGGGTNLEGLLERFYNRGLKTECINGDNLGEVVNDPNSGVVILESSDLDLSELNLLSKSNLPIVTTSQDLVKLANSEGIKLKYVPEETSIQAFVDKIIDYFYWFKTVNKPDKKNFAKIILKNSSFSQFDLKAFVTTKEELTFYEEHLKDLTGKPLNNLKKFSLLSAGIMSNMDDSYTLRAGLVATLAGVAFKQQIQDFIFDRLPYHSISSRLKDLAIMTSIKLKDKEITEIFHRLANYYEGHSVELSLIEQVFLVAKEFQAISFPRGIFRPNGAYIFISGINNLPADEKIKNSLSTFVRDLMTLPTAKVLTMPRKIGRDQMMKILNSIDSSISQDEVVVGLNQLESGQVVSRAIVDFYGRKLVEEQTVLNDELINKLSKLACLVPIIDPIIKKSNL